MSLMSEPKLLSPADLSDTAQDLADWTTQVACVEPAVDIMKVISHLGLGYREMDSCPRSSRLAIVHDQLEIHVRPAPHGLQRFWAAHEVGHFLLASRLALPFKEQVLYPRAEIFCNSYASHLLLPQPWLRGKAGNEPQSLLTSLHISSDAATSLPTTVAALNDRAGWRATLVLWSVDRYGHWRAMSVIGDRGCGLIGSADDTGPLLEELDAKVAHIALPIKVDGARREVPAEVIRWKDRCFSLIPQRLLAS